MYEKDRPSDAVLLNADQGERLSVVLTPNIVVEEGFAGELSQLHVDQIDSASKYFSDTD